MVLNREYHIEELRLQLNQYLVEGSHFVLCLCCSLVKYLKYFESLFVGFL